MFGNEGQRKVHVEMVLLPWRMLGEMMVASAPGAVHGG